MLGLYQNGRRSDALQVARNLRARLAEHEGLDPGPGLLDIEGAILRGDRTLEVRQLVPASATLATAPVSAPTPPPAQLPPAELAPAQLPPAQLPPDQHSFTARSEQRQRLDALSKHDQSAAWVTPVLVAAVVGTAGVGKTALAVHWDTGSASSSRWTVPVRQPARLLVQPAGVPVDGAGGFPAGGAGAGAL